jgi:hypothetical protein
MTDIQAPDQSQVIKFPAVPVVKDQAAAPRLGEEPDTLESSNAAAIYIAPTAEAWAAAIRPDLAAGTASYINAGRKFIAAKEALRKTKESFIHLVTVLLGHDLGTVERWMKIARHPVLSDSATLPNLPTAWTTLYELSQISADTLSRWITDGTVHRRLTHGAAVELRRSEGHDPDDDGSRDGADDHSHDSDPDDDPNHRDGDDRERPAASPTEDVPATKSGKDPAIGPDIPREIERKLARLEELEREVRYQANQLAAYETEIADLKAKLGPELPIPFQRKLFSQALRALQKAELPVTVLEKEKRGLKQNALTELVEFVRSAVRDGLKLERFDVFYRPEVH